jgi:hypothetical protein
LTNFPTSVDTFTNPGEFDQSPDVTVPHWTQHANLNDAMAAVQAFLLSGTVASGAFVRFKDNYLWLKDQSGSGTPWHKLYLELQDDQWVLVIDQTGQA